MTEPQLEAMSHFLTIDARHSRDLDDGIWVERDGDGWRVLVAIADAALAVEPESPWDLEARPRGATRYFASGNSPMLPRALAEDRLSLLPRRGRHVLAVRIELAADLSRRGVRLALERLGSVGRLAYEDVPLIVGRQTHPLHPVLATAAELADRLMAWRRDRGALALYDLNAGWLTTEEGQVKISARREDTIGQVIVQELMILANAAVAEHAIAADVPLLYRNHEARAAAPDRATLMAAIEAARLTPSTAIEALRERTHLLLGRARYGADVRGHFGLNLPAYLHCTSPIRRYADLVNHQQLRAHLRADPLPRSPDELAVIAAELNDRDDEERWATSARHKALADHGAERAIATRRLEGIGAAQFERVIKVERRGGAGPSEALAAAYPVRLRLGGVPLLCQALVLSAEGEAWRPLQTATLSDVAARLPDAVSLLAMLPQVAGWAPTAFTESASGAPHERRFTCRASLPGEAGVSAEGTGRTAKLARAAAALALLAARCGVPTPAIPAEPPPPSWRSPVSVLMERAQADGSAPPAFTFEASGPPHAPMVRCGCAVDGRQAHGEAPTKREAKNRAAAALLALLSAAPAIDNPLPRIGARD